MKRRTIVSGFAAALPLLGSRGLLAQGAAPMRSCRMISQDARGPFDLDEYLVRSDLRDGQPGMPLVLDFRVVNAMGCAPLPGARVTLWHSSPEGFYSGVDNIVLDATMTPTGQRIDKRGETFCRGVQIADADGKVRFVTKFPGWYYPRAPHLHLKVEPPDFGEEAVTQLYFAPEVCEGVYASEHYAARGPNPIKAVPGQEDPIFNTEAGDLWLDLKRSGDGYAASHELGVAFYGTMFGDLAELYRRS